MKSPINRTGLKSKRSKIVTAIVIFILAFIGFAAFQIHDHDRDLVDIVSNGPTAGSKTFTVPKNWVLIWSYACEPNKTGTFAVVVNNPRNKNDTNMQDVAESGNQGYGLVHEPEAGTFSFIAGSASCGYNVIVRAYSPAANSTHNQTIESVSGTAATPAQPKTLLTLSGNGSQQTQPFTTTGNWTLTYTYDCSGFGQAGDFIADINNTDGSSNTDTGPNSQGMSGGSTDYYYDTGQRYLTITSECDWTVMVKE
jgi:hypothetical protein